MWPNCHFYFLINQLHISAYNVATFSWEHFTLAVYATWCLLVLWVQPTNCIDHVSLFCLRGQYPVKRKLNPICHLLTFLGAHYILHLSRIRVTCARCLFAVMSQTSLECNLIRKWNFMFLMSIKTETHSVVCCCIFLCFQSIQEWFLYHWFWMFIHSFTVCLTTGPQPLPNQALHIVRSRVSSFGCECPLLSLRLSSSFVHLLPHFSVTSTSRFISPSLTGCRRQFLRKMWPSVYLFRVGYSSAPWL
jgi:hypothetical protein